MSREHLIPTSVTNANGDKITVYKKSEPSASKATNKRAPKPKSLKALITDAAVSLGISKAMGKQLGQKAEELPSDAQTAMLSLMNQPDPHGTVKQLLIDKFGKRYAGLWPEGTDPYKTPNMERFAAWVMHAEHHLHAVDAFCREISDTENFFPHVRTNHTLAGLRTHADRNFTVDQYRDIALVTAAVSTMRLKDLNRRYDLTKIDSLATEDGEYLNSGVVRDLISREPEKAAEAVRLITDELVLTEAELMHRLEGTPRGLVSGVI